MGQDPWILWIAPWCRIKGKPQAERPLPLLGDVSWMTVWNGKPKRDEAGHDIFVVKDVEMIHQSKKPK